MRSLALAFVLSMALLSTAALAEVPGLMNYQGTLTDGAGVALDTTVAMTFSIYDDSTPGTQVWTETQGSVEVSNGVFNILRGSVNAIADTVFNGPDRWLAVQVGGDVELVPRQRIASVGYAFTAGSSAAGADGDWTLAGDDMYAAVSGNVGIGDATPDCKLDVTGAINTDSVFSIGGTTVLSVEDYYHNTFVGEDAGANAINNTWDCTFVGYQAGYNNAALYNTFIGQKASYANTIGLGNTFVGRLAGRDNNTGSGNTFMGNAAGANNENGGGNTFLGSGAGDSNITGDWNTFVGNGAGGNNEGSYNTFVGYHAGADNVSGGGNTFLGRYAGYKNTIGNHNVFLGVEAGYLNTEGYSNTFVGKEAGSFNTTGYRNVALGWGAGYYNSTGNNNVFLGYKASYRETGSEKLYIANGPDTIDVLIYGNFATKKVGIGLVDPTHSLDVNGSINATGALYFDGETMLSTPSHTTYQDGNTYIGLNVGHFPDPFDPPNHGTLIGFAAGSVNDGDDNTFIGYSAGNANTTGHPNTFLGSNAGLLNTTGSDNTFLGYDAGYSNTGGSGNIFIGNRAGYFSVSDSNKLFIDNSSTTEPLIHGDFGNNLITFNGSVKITGAYWGDIGPNNGAPFPRSAYDSGWETMSAGDTLLLTHNIGGTVDTYVVEMQFKDTDDGRGINNIGYGVDGFNSRGSYYRNLTTSTIKLWRPNSDQFVNRIRIRIWVYN